MFTPVTGARSNIQYVMARPSGQVFWPVAATDQTPRDQFVFRCPPDRRWAPAEQATCCLHHQKVAPGTVASPSTSLHANEAALSEDNLDETVSSDCESTQHTRSASRQDYAACYGQHSHHEVLEPGACARAGDSDTSTDRLCGDVSGRGVGCESERSCCSQPFRAEATGAIVNVSAISPHEQARTPCMAAAREFSHSYSSANRSCGALHDRVRAASDQSQRVAPPATPKQEAEQATPPSGRENSASVPSEAPQEPESMAAQCIPSAHGADRLTSSYQNSSCEEECVRRPPEKIFVLQSLEASKRMRPATQTVSLSGIQNEPNQRSKQQRVALFTTLWYALHITSEV